MWARLCGLIIAGLVSGCGVANDPRSVAERFVRCMDNDDVAGACKYSCDTTAKLLTKGFVIAGPEIPRQSAVEYAKSLAHCTFIEVKESDGCSVVYFRKASDSKKIPVYVKQFDGKWKVALGYGISEMTLGVQVGQ
jgi:hypothetical protein